MRAGWKLGKLWMVVLIAAVIVPVEGQRGGGRGAPGIGAQPPLGSIPKPAVPNAKAARSCESLTMVALPNTTIQSAAADPANPDICRVIAVRRRLYGGHEAQ